MDGTQASFERRSRQVRLPSGRRFGVAEFGDPVGEPVLAFHGAPASRLMFDVTEDEAARLGLRIIAFDRPGYGLSSLDYGATLDRRTDAFVELADALGLERFSILGVSGGGPYSVALAARLGARIPALALISPLGPVAEMSSPHHLFSSSPTAEQAAQAEGEREGLKLSFGHRAFFLDLPRHSWVLRVNAEIAMRSFRAAPQFFAHTFAHLLPRADREVVADPVIAQSIVDMTLEATRAGIGGGIADLEIYSEPWLVDYERITARTKIWQGLEDLIVPVNASLHLARMIRSSVLERIPEVGHFWVYRHVGAVLAELGAMIQAQREPLVPPGISVHAAPVPETVRSIA